MSCDTLKDIKRQWIENLEEDPYHTKQMLESGLWIDKKDPLLKEILKHDPTRKSIKKNNNRIKVLITSIGSVNGINVLMALRNQNRYNLDIVVVDADELAPGFFLGEEQKKYVVSRASGKQYIKELLKICKKEKIDIIFPVLSAELITISKHKKKFERVGTKMLISDFDVFIKTFNKIDAQKIMGREGISCPQIYEDLENVKFPAIVKPICSSGTRNVFKVENKKELLFFKDYVKNSFVQEFIEGQEYTVDGISDNWGKVIDCISRKRLEAKYGLAWKSEIDYNSEIMGWAEMIAEGFKIIGPWNIQCIKNEKGVFFIDINARFPSGGLPLDVHIGLNLPVMALQILLEDNPFTIKHDKPWLYKNIYAMRYFDVVFARKHNNELSKVGNDWSKDE